MTKVNIIVNDAINWKPNQKVDAVLLDTPCSSTGTIRRNPDIVWRKDIKDILSMTKIQKKLLFSAINMVKKGCPIIYSNCSLEQEEGEEIIKYVNQNSKMTIDPILKNEIPYISELYIKNGLLRTFPYMLKEYGGIDGFFIARLVI